MTDEVYRQGGEQNMLAEREARLMPPCMILCGGLGTRLRDVTESLPKPMVPIGEQPILWHIMKIYASYGVRRFILCLGYKREVIVDYFMNYHLRVSDATIKLGHDNEITFHGENDESDWEVTLAGTGLHSMTGARIYKASRYLHETDANFFLTYGDGVADIDIMKLYKHHLASGRLMTVSAVHPAARFGSMIMSGDKVLGFEEKPAKGEGYINGGFMVINRAFVDKYLADDIDLSLEMGPMQTAAKDGEMIAYRHEGFWQCMDNSREYQLLNELWRSGKAPWKVNWR